MNAAIAVRRLACGLRDAAFEIIILPPQPGIAGLRYHARIAAQVCAEPVHSQAVFGSISHRKQLFA